jgi:hypothetical protein
MNPIAFMLPRQSDREDVIPLSTPIRTKSGEEISAIPVTKGQSIYASIFTYNRYVTAPPSEDTSFYLPLRRMIGFQAYGVLTPTNGTPLDFWATSLERIKRHLPSGYMETRMSTFCSFFFFFDKLNVSLG